MLLSATTSAFAATHRYEIVIDADYETMTVTARFERPVTSIRARSRDAGTFLLDAHDCDRSAELAARSRNLLLPSGGIRCLRYRVDLAAAGSSGQNRALLDDRNLAASPTVWMWRPRLGGGDDILATFTLPADGQVFVPWQPVDDRGLQYRLTASPQSGSAIALFGEFQEATVAHDAARLRVVLPGMRDPVALPPLLPWLEATIASVATAYGRFPNPGANVVLIPVGESRWDSGSAVSFGRVVRDGGETVELMINQHQPVANYYREWTPVHEFSHLMLPYLNRQQRWVSEGFAQYYQNVFMARSGQHSARAAWQKIHAGLERGRESAPTMSPNTAAQSRGGDTRMKIYWSGASLALMADVALREQSGGKESLDSVLGRLQTCCLPSSYAWSGTELFRKLDSLTDYPVFLTLYQRYADTRGFPDARPLLDRLGVDVENGEVRLQADAEYAAIRDAIMR